MRKHDTSLKTVRSGGADAVNPPGEATEPAENRRNWER